MPKSPRIGAADGTFMVRIGQVMVGVGLGVRVGGTGVGLGREVRVGTGGRGVSVGVGGKGVSVGVGGCGVWVGSCVMVGSGVDVWEGVGLTTRADAGVSVGRAPAMTSKFVSTICPTTNIVAARPPTASPPTTGTAHAARRLPREGTESSVTGCRQCWHVFGFVASSAPQCGQRVIPILGVLACRIPQVTPNVKRVSASEQLWRALCSRVVAHSSQLWYGYAVLPAHNNAVTWLSQTHALMREIVSELGMQPCDA